MPQSTSIFGIQLHIFDIDEIQTDEICSINMHIRMHMHININIKMQ